MPNEPESQQTALRQQALKPLLVASFLLLIIIGITVQRPIALVTEVSHTGGILMATSLWALILLLVWRGLVWHPHTHFGAANTITLFRAAGSVLLLPLLPIAEHLSAHTFWLLTAFTLLLLALDGVDGFLARRAGLSSIFGARFDMEVDALLILLISVLLWQSGEVAIWILAMGLMRYAFVLASLYSPPLRAPLFPSLRRKFVCVIQVMALCAMLSPLITSPYSQAIGALALACLSASFATDIYWLYQQAARKSQAISTNSAGP